MCEKKIIEQITQYFKIATLKKHGDDTMHLAKWAAVYLLRTETNLTYKAIAPLLGVTSPEAVGICFHRSLQEMASNRYLKKDIEKINEQLKIKA